MNRKFICSFAASVALLGAASAYAAVTTSTNIVSDSTAWAATFGGGTLAVSPVASFTGHVSHGLGASTSLIQTFQGVSGLLEGYGFYVTGSGNASPFTYTISLIDYGVTASRVDTSAEYNAVTSTVFQETFQLGAVPSGRQLYFDFMGGSTVSLLSTNSYGIVISSPSGASLTFDRSANDAYAGGAGYAGAIGAFNTGLGGGPRIVNFAVYTAAVPEPSSFAAVAGLAAVGLAMSRRRKR